MPQGSNAINLSWSTNGAGTTQEYKIFRSITDAQPSSVFATVLAGSGDTQSYVDASSLNGTYTYYYWVEASTDGTNSAAAGPVSSALSYNTPVLSVPSAPAPVTGTNVQLTVSATDPTGDWETMTYSWSLLSGPVGADVQLFDGTNLGINSIATPASTITATFTQAGTYAFSMMASDASGESNSVTVPVTVVQTLSGMTVSGANPTILVGQTDALTAEGIDQFGNPMPMPSGSAVSWSLEPYGVGGTVLGNSSNSILATYTAPASGVGEDTVDAGCGAYEADITIQVNQSPPPPAPTGLAVAEAVYGEIDLQWNPVVSSSLAGYNIYLSSAPIFSPSASYEIASDVTDNAYTQNFICDPSTDLYYEVVAVDNSGNASAPSAAVHTNMPTANPQDYPGIPQLDSDPIDGPDGEPIDGSDDSFFAPDADSNSSTDLIAFHGFDLNTPPKETDGDFFFENIVDKLVASGYTPQITEPFFQTTWYSYRDNDLMQALVDLLTKLDTNHDGAITQQEINDGPEIYILGYSWAALTAIQLSKLIAQPGQHLGGKWVPVPGTHGRFTQVGGWTLQASIPVQILETIDPVTGAFFGASWIFRNTSGPASNVIHFNNYYEVSPGYTQVEWYLEPDGSFDFGIADPYGDWIMANPLLGMWGSPLNGGQAEFYSPVDVSLEADTLQGEPFLESGVLIWQMLYGDQVQHDTIPLFVWGNVLNDFGIFNAFSNE